VRATLQAAREMRHRRLIVVFQPHRYSRLAALIEDFSRSFQDADRVLVVDVYSAGESNPTGIQASDLADLIPNGIYVGSFERARETLEGLVGPDDVLLLMGAGDIRKLGDELAQRI
jgi:UDP-N-acetylmuramate--alanine ligase